MLSGSPRTASCVAPAKYLQEGIDGFYRPRKGRGASVMTAEITSQAQDLLASGYSRKEVAEELGIKHDTLRKAIDQGRLQEPTPSTEESQKPALYQPTVVPSDKSSRSDADASTAEQMGIACTRPCERVFAAIGLLPDGASTQFQLCRDVSYGGVLCALPALAENGLFGHLQSLPVLSGYYTKVHIIVLLAYMALSSDLSKCHFSSQVECSEKGWIFKPQNHAHLERASRNYSL